MAFTATLEMDKDVAKISLVGELDASSATLFKTEIEKAAVHQPQKLVREHLSFAISTNT